MTSFCLWFQTSAIFLYLPDQKTLANMHIVTHLSCGLIKQIISSNVGGYRGMKAWYKPVEYTPLSTCIPLALCNHLTRKLSALPDPSNCISGIKTPIGNLRYWDRFGSLWQSPEDDLHLGLPFGYSTRVSHILCWYRPNIHIEYWTMNWWLILATVLTETEQLNDAVHALYCLL